MATVSKSRARSDRDRLRERILRYLGNLGHENPRLLPGIPVSDHRVYRMCLVNISGRRPRSPYAKPKNFTAVQSIDDGFVQSYEFALHLMVKYNRRQIRLRGKKWAIIKFDHKLHRAICRGERLGYDPVASDCSTDEPELDVLVGDRTEFTADYKSMVMSGFDVNIGLNFEREIGLDDSVLTPEMVVKWLKEEVAKAEARLLKKSKASKLQLVG